MYKNYKTDSIILACLLYLHSIVKGKKKRKKNDDLFRALASEKCHKIEKKATNNFKNPSSRTKIAYHLKRGYLAYIN